MLSLRRLLVVSLALFGTAGCSSSVRARAVTLADGGAAASRAVGDAVAATGSGVESYLAAAAELVADDGLVVLCADAQRPGRVIEGARAAGLSPRTRRDIVPREGKNALVGVWTLDRRGGALERLPDLVARDAQGARTPVQHELRAFFGLAIDDPNASPTLRARKGAPGSREVDVPRAIATDDEISAGVPAEPADAIAPGPPSPTTPVEISRRR